MRSFTRKTAATLTTLTTMSATTVLPALTATTVLTVLTVAAPAASAAAGARQAQPATHANGRVCLFDAPKEPMHAGHVGWAFRWSTNLSQWDYGATLGPDKGWRKHGSFERMLHDFATSPNAGGYRSYRCTVTLGSDQRAANAAVNRLNGRRYELLTDNCLTKSIEIVKAYDDSRGLDGMPGGGWSVPNAYYTFALDDSGWDGSIQLH